MGSKNVVRFNSYKYRVIYSSFHRFELRGRGKMFIIALCDFSRIGITLISFDKAVSSKPRNVVGPAHSTSKSYKYVYSYFHPLIYVSCKVEETYLFFALSDFFWIGTLCFVLCHVSCEVCWILEPNKSKSSIKLMLDLCLISSEK
jgi:hypothetical protein